jgi:hypothetical protein
LPGQKDIVMKKSYLFTFFFSLLSSAEMAITYPPLDTRLGDSLLAFAHAKWIAYQSNIPLLYKPFRYSSELAMDDDEIKFSEEKAIHYNRLVELGYGEKVDKESLIPTLYTLSYFPEAPHEHTADMRWPYVEVNWDDPQFRKALKKAIQPKKLFPLWKLPKDRISVALHVRRGGGFDPANMQDVAPWKFPSDVFYLEQIQRAYHHFEGKPLYVYIFTDDQNPQAIAKNYQEQLPTLDILFDYRKMDNRHDSNVLEDLFAMTQFDCLIRPESNYSRVASMIRDYLLEIYPGKFSYINGKPLIYQYFSKVRKPVSKITNPERSDGFGAQLQTVLCAALYAELNNLEYVYTPFQKMEHNYDKDPAFLEKKEELLNFTPFFQINEDLSLQNKINVAEYIRFFEAHLSELAHSEALKRIKKVFRENKKRDDYFDASHFHVAVHIRRPNPHDSRVEGSNAPYITYLNIIDQLREKHALKKPIFHIYSQGHLASFQRTFQGADIVLHINEPLEDTFTPMVLADALVMSASSLSYSAALLSDAEVYYMPFWHPPLPSWTPY